MAENKKCPNCGEPLGEDWKENWYTCPNCDLNPKVADALRSLKTSLELQRCMVDVICKHFKVDATSRAIFYIQAQERYRQIQESGR